MAIKLFKPVVFAAFLLFAQFNYLYAQTSKKPVKNSVSNAAFITFCKHSGSFNIIKNGKTIQTVEEDALLPDHIDANVSLEVKSGFVEITVLNVKVTAKAGGYFNIASHGDALRVSNRGESRPLDLEVAGLNIVLPVMAGVKIDSLALEVTRGKVFVIDGGILSVFKKGSSKPLILKNGAEENVKEQEPQDLGL